MLLLKSSVVTELLEMTLTDFVSLKRKAGWCVFKVTIMVFKGNYTVSFHLAPKWELPVEIYFPE